MQVGVELPLNTPPRRGDNINHNFVHNFWRRRSGVGVLDLKSSVKCSLSLSLGRAATRFQFELLSAAASMIETNTRSKKN